MSIITFLSEELKETGQTMSIAAVATAMAIEHNYKILLISTDFMDKTLENCFWNENTKRFNFFAKTNVTDISNSVEGLARLFASNRADKDIIKTYTKPVLNERLDVLQAPKAKNLKDYANITKYYPSIVELANSYYDIVLVDLSKKMEKEDRDKVINLSDILIVNLNQNMNSINNFMKLKKSNETFNKRNVALMLGKYNPHSKYTNKNVARYLKEKGIPMIVPYNILFSDECSEGRIIDYFLKIQKVEGFDNKDTYFIKQLRYTIEGIKLKIQEALNGTI